jgi:hypothetical protein
LKEPKLKSQNKKSAASEVVNAAERPVTFVVYFGRKNSDGEDKRI